MSAARTTAFQEAARAYAELGWALVRAEGKRAKGTRWQETKPDTPEHAAGLWGEWGARWNIGVVCGPSGVAVLDVDVEGDALAAYLELLGATGLPATPIVRTGSGKVQAYYADPGGLQKTVRDGFELRVGPHQCIAPPSVHPDSGKPYHWLVGHEPWTIPLAPLPQRLIDYFAAERDGNRAASPIGEVIPVGEIDTTLASLAGTMRRRGMSEAAIYAALVAELDRCEPGHTHSEEDCRRIARSVGGYAPATPPPGDDLATSPLPRQWLLRGSDLLAEPDPGPTPFLVEGLIVDRAIVACVGRWKTTKSYGLLELLVSVVTGEPAFGRFAIPEPGPVIYICEESGRAALWRRLDALCRGRAIDRDRLADLFLAANARVKLDDPGWQAELIAQGRDLRPRVFGFDPLARMKAPGRDENAQNEMAAVVEFLRELRDATDSGVSFVHHTGHSGEHMRGTSDLESVWETRLSWKRDGDSPEITLASEHRESEAGPPIRYRIAWDAETRTIRFPLVEADTLAKVRAYLGEHPGASANAVFDALGGKRKEVLEAVKTILSEGGTQDGYHSGTTAAGQASRGGTPDTPVGGRVPPSQSLRPNRYLRRVPLRPRFGRTSAAIPTSTRGRRHDRRGCVRAAAPARARRRGDRGADRRDRARPPGGGAADALDDGRRGRRVRPLHPTAHLRPEKRREARAPRGAWPRAGGPGGAGCLPCRRLIRAPGAGPGGEAAGGAVRPHRRSRSLKVLLPVSSPDAASYAAPSPPRWRAMSREMVSPRPVPP